MQGKARRGAEPVEPERADRGQPLGPQRHARAHPDKAIHQIGLEERGGQRAAPFAEDARQPAFGQRGHERGGRDMAARFGDGHAAGAERGEGVDALLRGVGPVAEPERGRIEAADQRGLARQVELGRDDDAQGLRAWAEAAHREPGIIGARRACAHQHSVVAGAQAVGQVAGLGAGDPFALAAGCGDAAIKGAGEFERQERAGAGDPAQSPRVIAARFFGEEPRLDGDPGGAQHGMAAPGGARIRVFERGDGLGDPRVDQRLGGLAAGLEGDIGRRAASRGASLRQRALLGIGLAAGAAAPPANDPAIARDHAADRRVGPCLAKPAPPEGERMGHMPPGGHSSPGSMPGRSSLTNLSKSSAAWKFL